MPRIIQPLHLGRWIPAWTQQELTPQLLCFPGFYPLLPVRLHAAHMTIWSCPSEYVPTDTRALPDPSKEIHRHGGLAGRP